jgi:hypothetical protein
MQRTACTSFSIATLSEGRLRANGVHTLKWMDGQRAEYHGGDHGEGTVKRGGVQSPAGSPRQRTRIKVNPGFRRQFAHGRSPTQHVR